MSPSRSGRAASAVVALVLPLALVACGGADASAEVVSEGPTTTAEAPDGSGDSTTTRDQGDTATTTTPATTTTGSDDTRTTLGGGDAPDDLSGALLTAADLPAGHVQSSDDIVLEGAAAGGEPLCAGGTSEPEPPIEQIQRTFHGRAGDLSSQVVSFVARFEDGEAGVDSLQSEFDRCGGHGDAFGYEVRELSGIGEEAFAVTYTAPGATGPGTLSYARVGDLLVGVTVVADPGLTIDVTALLAVSAGRA